MAKFSKAFSLQVLAQIHQVCNHNIWHLSDNHQRSCSTKWFLHNTEIYHTRFFNV